MKSCFFIGHREAGRELLPEITEAAERLILSEQVVLFYTGKYGRFDYLAGEAVAALKRKYPDVQLSLVIP